MCVTEMSFLLTLKVGDDDKNECFEAERRISRVCFLSFTFINILTYTYFPPSGHCGRVLSESLKAKVTPPYAKYVNCIHP